MPRCCFPLRGWRTVAAAAKPVFVRGPGAKDAAEFYARVGNATKPLSGEDMADYQREHWG